MAAKKPTAKPSQMASSSKKADFKPEGKRLEDVKDKVIPKPRLEVFYKEQVVPALMKKFNFKSIMEVPKLQKNLC